MTVSELQKQLKPMDAKAEIIFKDSMGYIYFPKSVYRETRLQHKDEDQLDMFDEYITLMEQNLVVLAG